jgi:ligand-binding sensor domain-containing protein/two-component sensor histidine kinase
MLPVIKIFLTKQKHALLCCHLRLFFLTVVVYQISFAQVNTDKNQKNNYRAVLWTSADGLSLGKKNTMLKDVNGFLWIISPAGLNRFDGSNFKVYSTDKSTPGTIDGFYSFSLVEDSLHNIWIGTNKGLSRYDIKADSFKNFYTPVSSVTSIASIIPFWATNNEIYCLEAGCRITVYNIHSLEKKILQTFDKNSLVMNNITIPHSVYDARSNSVWMLSGEYGIPGGGLVQVALTEKKLIHYEWQCFKKIPGHAHYSYGMCYDLKRNSIWINSVEGLLEFTLADKKFHAVAACNELMNLDNIETIAGITLNRYGKILLYRYAKGIVIYDPESQTALPLFPDSTIQHEVSDENISIYCDRDDMIWCGYLPAKGIYQLIPFLSAVSRIPINTLRPVKKSYSFVLNIGEADKGKLWISTWGGLNIFDPLSDSLKRLSKQNFPGLEEGNIVPIGINNSQQKAWLHTWYPSTFYEMDIQTRMCRKIPVKNMNNKEIKSIYPDPVTADPYKNGFIFLVDKKGIFTVSSDSAIVQQVVDLPYHVTGMAVAAEKRIFLRLSFGGTNLSYFERNGKWVQTTTPLDSIEWFNILYDTTSKSYWAGCLKQLYHFDKDFKLIRRYTEKDGFPGIDVMSIIKDNGGNIWFNSSQGHISQINAKTGILTVLSEKDGYKKQEFRWPTPRFKDEYGDLYFAGVDCIDRISPDKLDLFPPSKIYLKSLTINQEPLSLNTGINSIDLLSLKYDQNSIMIETGVIDYYSKGKGNIRYKLEGLNDDWQYSPANYSIRFEKLLPRKYKLVIQASSSGNNFNGSEKILIINISPAFWDTWWFRASAFLCLVGIIYVLMRLRVKEKFRLRLERSEKDKLLADMRQKTVELEMKALRSQMNPHFIFNSLNSINRFILQNNRPMASEYLTKFSRLVRLILQNSQAALITVESELESLQLYLDLESLRFDYHFAYKISISPDLDISVLKIPPLIIQPYVENAIWHGLMHKDEKGRLDIEILQESNYLIIKIADDGVGRKKSADLYARSSTHHRSMGLQITADRIAMMQPNDSKEQAVNFIDLVASDGSSAGTEVIIKMPLVYD